MPPFPSACDEGSGAPFERSRIEICAILIATALTGAAVAQPASDRESISKVNRGLVTVITGPVDSTAARMGAELADVLDDGATRRILPIVGKGSVQNVTDLRSLRGVDAAIIQIDVLTQLRAGRSRGLENAITYISRLHNEEVHILADERVEKIEDLAGSKVNFGVSGSGASVTAATLFNMLKIPVDVTSFDDTLALEMLKNGQIAALVSVAGKPAPVFLSRRVPRGMHFLPVPLTAEVRSAYLPSRFTAEDYPQLVVAERPVETVAVGTVLAVANFPPESERYRNLANFVDVFFTQSAKFQEPPRHPKWQEVDVAADLPGWRRFGPAQEWLRRNAPTGPAVAERELKDMFVRFIDERAKLSGSSTMSQERKNELFEQFRRWQQQSGRGR
jgi:TRAP transporter TAXI family solute receptor